MVGFSEIRFRNLHVDYLIYTWYATVSQILQLNYIKVGLNIRMSPDIKLPAVLGVCY